jgi:hypothetical protein
VVPTSFEESDLVRRRVIENLTEFLHPLKGGPDRRGWDFGRDVFLSEIAAVIEDTTGVDHVAQASVRGSVNGIDRTDPDGSRVEIRDVDGELPASGVHTVTMSPA